MTHEELDDFRYSKHWSPTQLALFFRIPVQSVYDMEEGRVPIPEHLERHVLSGEPVPGPDEGKIRTPDPIIRKPKPRRAKRSASASMSGSELRTLRKAAGLTIAQAASIFTDDKGNYRTPSAWASMESGKSLVPDGLGFLVASAADEAKYAPAESRLTTRHLTAFRRKYSLSQSAIAERLNKSLSTWKRYETGKAQVPQALRPALIALAKKLNEEK